MKDLIYKIYSKKTIERLSKKINLLGVNSKLTVEKYLSSFTFSFIFFSIIIIYIFINKIYLSVLLIILFIFAYEYAAIDIKIKKRKNILNKEALFFFQILLLTLESGNNLKKGLELTTESINGELSDEFKKVINDINIGCMMNEALKDLKSRIPSETINDIIINLTESNSFGTSMIESLKYQIDYLNDKLVMTTKERINEMPIKISIVSVVIFIPLILLIILSPLIIKLLTQ